MREAKNVHSTPPTKTSVTRRNIITGIATIGVAATGLAVAPARGAAPAIDPIFAAIEQHKQAAAAHDSATELRARFNDVDDMDKEKLQQLYALEAAADDARDSLDDIGSDLVNTKPATLAGIVALCRYIEPLLNNDGDLPEVVYWDDETESSAAGAFANVIAAAVEALIKAQAGQAVQA